MPGQPPLIIKPARCLKSTSPVNFGSSSLLHNFLSDISPVESPDSNKLIVLKCILPNRPAPLCDIPFLLGVEDPVKIYCPFSPVLSTSARISSHKFVASCHSSISFGFLPSKINEGEILASSTLLDNSPVVLCKRTSLLE